MTNYLLGVNTFFYKFAACFAETHNPYDQDK